MKFWTTQKWGLLNYYVYTSYVSGYEFKFKLMKKKKQETPRQRPHPETVLSYSLVTVMTSHQEFVMIWLKFTESFSKGSEMWEGLSLKQI